MWPETEQWVQPGGELLGGMFKREAGSGKRKKDGGNGLSLEKVSISVEKAQQALYTPVSKAFQPSR